MQGAVRQQILTEGKGRLCGFPSLQAKDHAQEIHSLFDARIANALVGKLGAWNSDSVV